MNFRKSTKLSERGHDKARGMVKETAKDRFLNEKKQLEHEYHENKEIIEKLMNEKYDYFGTKEMHSMYYVSFKNSANGDIQELLFQFHDNYSKLKDMWE